jgi:diguanylate cyclase (GGDEF)-like protein
MFPETWLLFFAALCMSFLAAVVTQSYQDLKMLKNSLEVLSNSDPLTGIYNRRHFMESAELQMERIFRQKSKSFIIMLDLDHFKSVNDKYGHQSGDIVLKEAAARISSTLRPYDLFARYGGEEFVIYVTDIDHDAVFALAERIRQNISKSSICVKDGSKLADITVTASIGIALSAPENKLDESIALADKALYSAKADGRDRVVFLEESE